MTCAHFMPVHNDPKSSRTGLGLKPGTSYMLGKNCTTISVSEAILTIDL